MIRSYRDLPKILYHFGIKERDEPRPRAGVLRTREFIMKDSYTFDRDPEGLDAAYQKHVVAYDRILDRCGLEWYRVESDVGMMGGSGRTSTWRRAPPARTRWRSRRGMRPTSRSPPPRPSASSFPPPGRRARRPSRRLG